MNQFRRSLLVARRELRDSLSDWRIIAPFFVLTFIFPWLVVYSTQFGIRYAERYDPGLVLAQLVPFAVMVVGFFPISFSLVIALESFVGEKERNTLESLLSTPITDGALYMGKLLSSLVLPLSGSILAMALCTYGLPRVTGHAVPLDLLAQILCLTVTLALGMVAGAVVVSSNTTSVRAANLLASFIVIPATLLVGFQTLVVLQGHREVLWYIAAAQGLADLALIRMGTRVFNREEMLSRTLDRIDPRRALRTFANFFRQEPGAVASGRPSARLTPGRLYRRDLPQLLKRNLGATVVVCLLSVGAFALGWAYARAIPLAPGASEAWKSSSEEIQGTGVAYFQQFFGHQPWFIFRQNLVDLFLAALAGLISFGAAAVVPLFATAGLGGFLAGEAANLGLNLGAFSALVWPHGILEIPAAILATAAGLRMGAAVLSPPRGLTLGETLLLGLADFFKLLLILIIPLLLAAAFLEIYVTPHVAVWALGGH